MDMSTKWYEKALNNTCPECKKAIKHAVVCHRHKQLYAWIAAVIANT